MPEEERLRLLAMRERIALIRSWTDNASETDFIGNLLVRDAVALSLMIIGGAAPVGVDQGGSPEIP